MEIVLTVIEGAAVGMVAGFLVGFVFACGAVEHMIRRDAAGFRARLL